jgi:hypothetical protein
MSTQITALLNSPQVTALLTTVALGALYFVVGKVGSALEALGAKRGIVALVVVGKRLEAIAYDGPKLAGKPGAPETAPTTPAVPS